MKRIAAAIFACAVLGPAAAAGETLPVPSGATVLTVGGLIGNRNAGGEARFDIDTLRALGVETFTTSTIWTDGPRVFTGVPLDALLAAVEPSGQTLVATALSAADLAERRGWRLEIVDLRSLNPLDFDTVADSVRKTGRAVVMHEGPRTLGFGAELAARIQEELFYDLEAPVLRATGFDTPYPPARLEKLWLPGPDRLLDCVERAMELP